MKRVLRSAFILFTLALVSQASHVTAASVNPIKSLTMTPSSVQKIVQPGSTTSGSFQVLNQGQVDYRVHIYAAPYFVKGEDYTPDFTPLPGHPDITKWLTFSTSEKSIASTKSLTVNYTLNVPAGTPAGGYYAVAFAETSTGISSQGVLINERVGEIFYIQVAGPVKQAGKVTSWSSPFLQKSPLAATLRLEDDGGVHYQSNIQLVVRDLFGNPKYTLTSQREILPQTIRRIPFEWKSAPAFGLFKVTGTATIFGKSQALPTKYVLVMSTTVRLILGAILALIIILIITRISLKRRSAPKKSV